MIKKIIVLILFVIVITTFGLFIENKYATSKSSRNVLNSKKVKIGMAKNEVLQIMGVPDSKILSYFEKKDTMYYYQPPFGASAGIYIQFSDSSGFVNRIILNE